MGELTLPLKAEYFNQIKSGEKLEEYRLATPYWVKRLENRTYATVTLTLGYPSRLDTDPDDIVGYWLLFDASPQQQEMK